MKNISSKNLNFITLFRGLAAFVVASGHLFGSLSDHLEHESVLIQTLLYPTKFGQYAVYLFLTLSGFSLMRSERIRNIKNSESTPFKVYFKRRVWRIIPVYYLSIIFGFISTIYLRKKVILPNSELSVIGVFSHFLFFDSLNENWRYQTNPALWTIAAEMQCYLLLPLIYRFRSFKSVLLSSLFLYTVVKLLTLSTNLGVFALLYFFLLGVLISEYSLNYRFRPLIQILILALTLPFVLCQSIAKYGRVPELVIWTLFFTSLFLIFEYLEDRKRFIFPKFLVWIGRASYSLYASHYPVIYFTWWYVSKTTYSYSVQLGLLAIIGIPSIAIVTVIVYRLIEVPSLRFSKALK